VLEDINEIERGHVFAHLIWGKELSVRSVTTGVSGHDRALCATMLRNLILIKVSRSGFWPTLSARGFSP
jgi:hypothetical protein